MHRVSIYGGRGVVNNANDHVFALHTIPKGNLVVEDCHETCILEV
jgi:hypothetical protein